LIARVRRGITRWIGAYQEGYLERGEFEPRIGSAKKRLAKPEAEAKATAERDAEALSLRTGVDRIQLFADRIRDGLQDADLALIGHVRICRSPER
jgi:site-specific DNA recombinase